MVHRNYCWKGTAPSGDGAQIDLVLEWKGERTDYVYEIKYSENIFCIDSKYERELLNKIDAFVHSRQHYPSHSINTVFKSLLSISAVTFFTKDVFPQRRGEISIVLIP